MLQSMTGYGKAEVMYGNCKLHVEIKSLNSKNLDVSTKLSSQIYSKDLQVRAFLAERLVRGKVEACIWSEATDALAVASLNKDVVRGYVVQINEASAELGIDAPKDYWATLSHLPNLTMQQASGEVSDEQWAAVMAALGEAVDRLQEFRRQEGRAVKAKFEANLDRIASLLADVEPYEAARVAKIRSQLLDQLQTMPTGSYDPNRLEQEMIYYIEKLDINEEKQRLTNHIDYFRQTMEQDGAVGKKLGFIAQEMGREINTLGSKSNQAEMQNIVVRMKDELEQIKEQVLNVL